MNQAAQETTGVYWSLGVTPAQSWIAEARRSRDLLAGSHLLSLLVGHLLVALPAGTRFLLPKLERDDLSRLDVGLAEALSAGVARVPNDASGWLPGDAEGARGSSRRSKGGGCRLPAEAPAQALGRRGAEVAESWYRRIELT